MPKCSSLVQITTAASLSDTPERGWHICNAPLELHAVVFDKKHDASPVQLGQVPLSQQRPQVAPSSGCQPGVSRGKALKKPLQLEHIEANMGQPHCQGCVLSITGMLGMTGKINCICKMWAKSCCHYRANIIYILPRSMHKC